MLSQALLEKTDVSCMLTQVLAVPQWETAGESLGGYPELQIEKSWGLNSVNTWPVRRWQGELLQRKL